VGLLPSAAEVFIALESLQQVESEVKNVMMPAYMKV
jgi:hypothetical protein